MKHNLLYAATLLSALGCGLIAGVFFSFSSFVMKSLVKLPPTQGIAAMQSINVVVINRWFMSVFFGTAIICLVLAILSVFRWQTPGAGYRLIGSLLYLLGTILVTIVCNVPLNDSLAAVDPTSANAAQAWAHYDTTWTAWNHLRTIAASCSCGGIYCGVLSGCVAGGGKIFVRKPRTRSSLGYEHTNIERT